MEQVSQSTFSQIPLETVNAAPVLFGGTAFREGIHGAMQFPLLSLLIALFNTFRGFLKE